MKTTNILRWIEYNTVRFSSNRFVTLTLKCIELKIEIFSNNLKFNKTLQYFLIKKTKHF